MVTSQASEAGAKPPVPEKSSWIFNLSFILNLLAMFAGSCGALVHVVSLFRTAQPPFFVLTRLFAIVMCLLVVLTETESPRFFSWFGILESWLGRGLFAIFTGALLNTLHREHVEDENADGVLWVVVQMATVLLLVVGALYSIFGALCLKLIKENKIQQMQRRENIRHEKAELEMRRNEIESMLQETELKLQRSLV